jgi:surface polysaccharide O-acyltransferase-like enzyme
VYIALKISAIPEKIVKYLQIIGSSAFGIYLIHPFILGILAAIFHKIGFDFNNWLYYPVFFLLVLNLSLVFIYAMNKVPYHEYIIGSLR